MKKSAPAPKPSFTIEVDTNSYGEFVWQIRAANNRVVSKSVDSYTRKEHCITVASRLANMRIVVKDLTAKKK